MDRLEPIHSVIYSQKVEKLLSGISFREIENDQSYSAVIRLNKIITNALVREQARKSGSQKVT